MVGDVGEVDQDGQADGQANGQADGQAAQATHATQAMLKQADAHADALSVAYQRQGNYTQSLRDSEVSIARAYGRGNRQAIGEGQLRRAIALFFLKKYADGARCIELAEKYGSKDKTLPIWKAKFDDQKIEIENSKVEIDDLPIIKADEKDSESENDSEQGSNFGDAVAEKDRLKEKDIQAKSQTLANSISTPTASELPVITRYDFYQTSKTLNVSLFVKNAPRDQIKVEFKPRSVKISYPQVSGELYSYQLGELHATIDPARSKFKVYASKIEVELAKNDTQKWSSLLKEDAEPAEPAKPNVSLKEIQSEINKIPSSSKWDKIVEKELVEEEGADASDFFKELYKNADENTRRAMQKSYIESNGTALSTDWSSVSKGKVETSPPEGLQAKPW